MTEQMPLELETRNKELETDQLETRNKYRERLRQHLKDPDFRAIEGFPIGDDEAILALSDPPYYTACPNPFLPEIIERWQAERAQLRNELGLPDDSADNGDSPSPDGWERGPGGEGVYHREPFASDVSEGKNDPIYNAHSYHTKVPHKAVMRYILHYTDPGDIVFDGFCGTGMTGVAAQLCGDKKTVESLGFRVSSSGDCIPIDQPETRNSGLETGHYPKLGARKAVLVDLCPAATFIAYNYNTPVDVATFKREANRILHEVEDECGWMYETWHPYCDHPQRVRGRINYTIWSDVFVCPECGHEMTFWDVAVDREASQVRKSFSCPGCGAEQSKRTLERAWEMVYDRALGKTIRRAKQVPVLINYNVGKKRHEKAPNAEDLALLQRIEESDIPCWFPTDALPDGYNTRQPMESHGITHVHHFYTRRNLAALARYRHLAFQCLRTTVGMNVTATALKLSRLARYMFDSAGRIQNGVLYLASLYQEMSPLLLLDVAPQYIGRYRENTSHFERDTAIYTGSLSDVPTLPANSVDYIFTDPPFGANLMYSELNFIWEAWLQVFTNNETEAVVNKVQHKGLMEYQHLMEHCFREFYRALSLAAG